MDLAFVSPAERLLASPESAIRLRILEDVLGVPSASPAVRTARARTAASERVAPAVRARTDGTIPCHPYSATWYRAHWVLVTSAELGYPAGDRSLLPLREQALGWLMSEEYQARRIGSVRGLVHMHASIDGNMVWALLRRWMVPGSWHEEQEVPDAWTHLVWERRLGPTGALRRLDVRPLRPGRPEGSMRPAGRGSAAAPRP